MIDIPDAAQLRGRIGEDVAVSDWLLVTQERIDQFASATEDEQWIHVNPARAAAESPFKTTIAHGFLTLSLVSSLSRRAMSFSGIRMAVNYGVNRVRFMTTVPAGSRIRGRFVPIAVAEVGGGIQITWSVTIEREDWERPCCVAEWIVRYHPQ